MGPWGMEGSHKCQSHGEGRWGQEAIAQKRWNGLYQLAVTNYVKVIHYIHHPKPLFIQQIFVKNLLCAQDW